MMDADTMARMAAQIQNGWSKEDSKLVTDDESSAFWDQLVAYFEQNPGVAVEIPNEWPTLPDSPDTAPGETPA